MPQPVETFLSISLEWPRLFTYNILFFRFTELYVVYICRSDKDLEGISRGGCFQENYLKENDFFQLWEKCQKLVPHHLIIKKDLSPKEVDDIYTRQYLMDSYWHQELYYNYEKGNYVTEKCKLVQTSSIESIYQIINSNAHGICQFYCDGCGHDVDDNMIYHCQQCFKLDDDGCPMECFDLCTDCFNNGPLAKEHKLDFPDHQLIQKQMINIV